MSACMTTNVTTHCPLFYVIASLMVDFQYFMFSSTHSLSHIRQVTVCKDNLSLCLWSSAQYFSASLSSGVHQRAGFSTQPALGTLCKTLTLYGHSQWWFDLRLAFAWTLPSVSIFRECNFQDRCCFFFCFFFLGEFAGPLWFGVETGRFPKTEEEKTPCCVRTHRLNAHR